MAITRITGPDGEPLENAFVSNISPDGDTLLLQRGNSFDAAIYDVNSGGFTLLPNTVEGQQLPQFNYEGLSSGTLLLLEAEFDISNSGFFDPELAVVEADGTVVRVLDPPAGSPYFTPQFLGEDRVAVGVTPIGNAEAPPFDVEVIDLATGAATGIDVGDGGDRGLGLIDASADGGVLLISPDYSAEEPRFSIYDAAAEQVREAPVDLPNVLDTLQLTPDGTGLLGITAEPSNTVGLYDLTTGAPRFEAELPEETSGGSLAIDSTGRFVAAGSQDTSVEGGGGRQVLSVFDLDDGGETSIELGPLFPDARLVQNPSPVAVREVDGAPAVTLELDVAGGRGLFDVGLDVLAVPDRATTGGATVAIDAPANDVDFGDNGLRLVAAGPAGNGVTSIDDRGTTDPTDDRLLYTPDTGFAGTDRFAYTVRDGGGAVDEGEVLVLVTAPDPEGFTVTTAKDAVADDGELSLREAVLRANADPGADTITFADGLRGATIALQGREAGVDEGLVVTDDLTIDGDLSDGGTGGITIGDPIEPYRDVGGGYEYDGGVQVLRVEGARLGLEDLTITGGNTGVYAADATLDATRVGIDGVGALGSATGIRSRSSTVTLSDGFISRTNGYYEAFETAISARGSDVTLLRSAVTYNTSYYGQTIAVDGRLRVDQSLIAGNVVQRDDGIVGVSGVLEIVNSTIANNAFVNNYDGTGIGVTLESGTGTITNSTIAGNLLDADNPGAFALFAEPGAAMTLENSLVIDNDGDDYYGSSSEARDVGGSIVSNGRNIFGQDSVDGATATDVTGASIADVFVRIIHGENGFPDLADNGGPTATLALLQSPANPAIDAADPAAAPDVDQRGFERDATPDIGAFEAGAGPDTPPPPPAGDLFVVTTASDVVDANDGVTSLREAVSATNARAGADTITFADALKGGEIRLEQGTIAITGDTVIDGDAADGGFGALTIVDARSGGGTYALVTATGGGVRFEDVAIDGRGGEGGYGNVITGENVELDLVRARVAGSYLGNNVAVEEGKLQVLDSLIENFSSGGTGTGIRATGDVLVERSTVQNGGGEIGGVGVAVAGNLTLKDSLIADASGNASAGGVAVDAGTLTMENTTITGLSGGYEGGNVVRLGESVQGTITNSTLAGNDFVNPDFEEGLGGVSVFDLASGADLRLENSLVLANIIPGGDAPLVAGGGGLASNGGNAFEQADVAEAAAGDVVGADPTQVFDAFQIVFRATPIGESGLTGELAIAVPELADNGGPTATIALKNDPSNPAIGQAVAADAPATDGRGFARDADPDAGAFEAGAAPPPPPASDAFVVTTLDDAVDANDGVLSLREAVASANLKAGADTITFADDLKGATLLLDGGPLTITDDLTLDGDAADGGVGGVTLTELVPTYSGTFTPSFITVESGIVADFEDLTITQDGRYAFEEAAETKLFGDGADIGLDRVRIGDLGRGYGATAVQVQGGSLGVADSIIEGIYGSDGNARGIEATDGAFVSIARTALSGINGTYNGYAVDVEGTLDLQDSAITGVSGRYGGFGVRVDGTFDVANVTVSNLRGPGGYDDEPGGGAGVSILTGGTGTITNATIAGNVVGAGIEVADGAEVRLENSVVAENYQSQNLDPTGRDTPIGNEENLILHDVVGAIDSNGGNVLAQGAVGGSAAGDVLGADPNAVFADFETVAYQGTPGEVDPVVLPAAADNGGPTPTIALKDDPMNSAIGQAVAADAPPTDGRGFERDADPDAGAFEAGAGPVAPPPPGTGPFVVTTADDVVDASDGVLSLREAVDAANARIGADTVILADDLAGATLTLVGGGLATITDDLAVDGGEGASAVTVTAPRGEGDNDPTIGAIFTAENADLDLRDLTLRDANNGVTALDATVTLDRVFLDDNGGRYGGGGVSVTSSTLIVTDGTIASYGGESNAAIRAIDGSDVRLLRSEVTGGGRYQASIDVDGSLGIDQSLITATGGVDGGTIEIDGRLDVINSTVARNRLPGTYQAEPFLNTDIGVIKLDAGSTGTITNSTIAGNTGTLALALAPDAYGPALLIDAGATLELANSIVAGNLLFPDDTNGETAPFVQDVVGRIESNGRNIFSQDDVDGAKATDLQGVDPSNLFTIVAVDDRLLPDLADNGGPTRTIALKDDPANPAIGAADPADAPAVDGRGFERDELPDIGAFEAGAEGGPDTPLPDDVASIDITFVSADADYANSLGFYVRDGAGNLTGEAGVLFPEVSDRALDPGNATGAVGFPGDIGLFLVRDGAKLGIDWGTGTTRIEDGKLVHAAPDGATTTLKDDQVHFDFEPGQLRIQETSPEIYEWEDKAVSEDSYDGDFDDAVFEVIKERVPPPILLPEVGPDAVPAGGGDLFGV